jgi:hypothetical protein
MRRAIMRFIDLAEAPHMPPLEELALASVREEVGLAVADLALADDTRIVHCLPLTIAHCFGWEFSAPNGHSFLLLNSVDSEAMLRVATDLLRSSLAAQSVALVVVGLSS